MTTNETQVLATLYFLPNQYLFEMIKKDGVCMRKLLNQQDVASVFSQEPFDSGWIDPGTVRTGRRGGQRWTVYYAGPCVRLMDIGEGKPLKVPLPATVLVSFGTNHFLYALREEDTFPYGNQREAMLYNAPLPNVFSNGGICWGNVGVPNVQDTQPGKIWELFMSSTFNNHLCDQKSVRFPNMILDQWKELSMGKAKRYPEEDLIKYERLDLIIERLVRYGTH